jgi:hypothetical protein
MDDFDHETPEVLASIMDLDAALRCIAGANLANVTRAANDIPAIVDFVAGHSSGKTGSL